MRNKPPVTQQECRLDPTTTLVSTTDLQSRITYCNPAFVQVRATLNKSLAARSALVWAVCGVANPRHSWAMAVVCALQPIPNQGAHTREDLFSMALAATRLRR